LLKINHACKLSEAVESAQTLVSITGGAAEGYLINRILNSSVHDRFNTGC
jgi:hypothetical protein